MLPTTKKITMPKNIGANACKSIAAFQCPWASRTIARVRPHAGQITPSVDFTGHCHAVVPVAVNATCTSPTAASRTMICRFCIKGPNTGVNNLLLVRIMLMEPAVIEGLASPVKLLLVVIFFLAMSEKQYSFNYPNYRHLSENLYLFANYEARLLD
jgi:hypothetical protein